ncbi:MAG: UvrD-helicase domain-containing protein [Acidimicrobiales bacterium]
MTTLAPIADQDARDRIAGDLDTTLFVEAGAGSGKTKALVDRIVALVAAGTAIDQIAAITFTEKAAAELRERIRMRLLHQVAEAGPDSVFAAALERLDHAAISTLHAFAQRLLFEHPIEAGLPPGVEVLDELGSQLAFDDRWERQLPLLLTDPDLAAPLLVADALGIGPTHLRGLAVAFEDNWDLVEERLDRSPPPPTIDVEPLCRALQALAAEAEHCSDPDDKLAIRLRSLEQYADALAEAASADDPVDGLTTIAELLRAPEPRFATDGKPFRNLGKAGNWPGGTDQAGRLKAELFAVGTQRDVLCASLTETVIHRLAAAVGSFVLDGVAERRSAGRLRFHDLLVLAREVLRHPDHGAEVRRSVRTRYQRLLIDEFQDTDPIQVDLAVLIAAGGPVDGRSWSRIETEPGRLFFVGDPKQSIYRFRRADIATYLRCQDRFGGGDATVALTSNFRSAGPVIDWVNEVFAVLISHEPDSQPRYMALDPTQPAPAVGPGVRVFGALHEDKPNADELRHREAAGVVDAIRAAIDEGWTVRERTGPGEATERAARLGDITILLPARTALPALERALEAAGIAYRAETASLVYSSAEVRELMTIARAIDDPTDELAVVAALRTPAFGCGDDDLARHRLVHGGSWDHRRLDDSLPADDPVVEALAWLAARHDERTWTTPAAMLDRIARERRLFELGVLDGRHREVWRRLRFVIDQARAWTDSTRGDLRAYLRWARLQASESARVAETVLPETDTDAVRIMTVHASKGLEFPITIVSGLTTQAQGIRSGVQVAFPPDGGIGYRFGAANTTATFERFAPIDEEMGAHERLRLLYVACTRASDHLVVSVHRTPAGPRGSLASELAEALDPAALMVAAGIDGHDGPGGVSDDPLGDGTPVAALDPADSDDAGAGDDTDGAADGGAVTHRTDAVAPSRRRAERTEWRAERERVLAAARRSRTVSATALAAAAADADRRLLPGPETDPGADPGLAKAPRNLDLPSWQKGRYGTAVGRAVHGVLQTCDLATGRDIDAQAAAQAAAEGILDREQIVARLARSALESPTVADAIGRRHWRELFVAAPVGDRLLEGYIDLLYEADDGLVVVDYKTDVVSGEAELAAKVARYGVQAAAYAIAVEAATGIAVTRAVLVFLTETDPLDVVVADLDANRQRAAATAAAIDLGTTDPDD